MCPQGNLVKICNRTRPLVIFGDKVLVSRHLKLYLLSLVDNSLEYIGKIPVEWWKNVLCCSRFFERLLRAEPKAAIEIDRRSALVSFLGTVYYVDIEKKIVVEEHKFKPGMNNPLYFSRVTGLPSYKDCILYGEYSLNNDRSSNSAVYSRDMKTREWEKIYEWSNTEIRHIHGITSDIENDAIYIMTGDLDSESGIWVTHDGFKTVQSVLHGSQKYRTGFLFKMDDKWVYPTDTAVEQNYVYVNENFHNNHPLFELDASCVSAIDTENKVLIATAVEADERVRGWKSWINYRLGPGIKKRSCQLISIDKKTLGKREVLEFKKDLLPYKLFQYGTMIMKDVPEMKMILVYPIGVKKCDGKLFKLKYSELEI